MLFLHNIGVLNLLTLYLLVSSADNFCKQLWPRSGPTKRILEIIFRTSWFWKKSADDKSKKGFDNPIIAEVGIFCDNSENIYIYALAEIATWQARDLYGLHVSNANPADPWCWYNKYRTVNFEF